MILRAFVGSRQRPQHFIIFLYGFRVPEREKLGDLFPVPSGVEDNSRAGTDTPAGGRGAKISKAARLQDHAPSFGNASAENPTREGKRPHGPRVEVLPTIPGPGQLNTCPGQQGRRNRNTPGGGWNFPIFPTPLKSEFSEFWDTVKRGISSGDCATIGDTFSERETLSFLQRKKGVKSELKEPDKKGGTVPVVYVETGRLRAFIPVEALAVVPWDWRAKGEPIRERLEALAVPDC